jgi:uncharacterized protein DUF3375
MCAPWRSPNWRRAWPITFTACAKSWEEAFPRRAEQYLDDWAADSRGWLRKYYPPGSDEAHFDLTPPTERAIDWIAGFSDRFRLKKA